LKVVVGAASDPGRLRTNNEDSYAVLQRPGLPAGLDAILVVADGMGGHQAGEVASQIIVEEFRRSFATPADRTQPIELDRDWRQDLERTILTANDDVREQAALVPEHLGMGSTVVAVAIAGPRLYLGNVGDSRAYLISDARIYQLSHDHSWVAEQVRAGVLGEGEARHHPRKNVLTRAVGAVPAVEVDVSAFELAPGDFVILCTDGLTNVVDDDELVHAVESRPPSEAAPWLIDLANQRGAPDNVTVVIAQITE
jgi:protein phosphatase